MPADTTLPSGHSFNSIFQVVMSPLDARSFLSPHGLLRIVMSLFLCFSVPPRTHMSTSHVTSVQIQWLLDLSIRVLTQIPWLDDLCKVASKPIQEVQSWLDWEMLTLRPSTYLGGASLAAAITHLEQALQKSAAAGSSSGPAVFLCGAELTVADVSQGGGKGDRARAECCMRHHDTSKIIAISHCVQTGSQHQAVQLCKTVPQIHQSLLCLLKLVVGCSQRGCCNCVRGFIVLIKAHVPSCKRIQVTLSCEVQRRTL